MAKISSKVANWLYSVLQPQYLHKEIAYSHLYHFLSTYLPQGFKIRTAVYTSVSGHSQLLINLYGRLDCGTCLVPLNIWIPLNYPFQDENIPSSEPNGVPVVFVVPEHGLVIKPNNNVDLQGRFYHPFVSSWHQNYTPTAQTREFSLLSLMAHLRATFEQNPPLNTKSEPPSAPSEPQNLPPTNTGPRLPPKKSYNEGQEQTPEQPRRETNGPPLPQKPLSAQHTQESAIPEKYRSPLPLPGQMAPSPVRVQSPPQANRVVKAPAPYLDESDLHGPIGLRPQGPGKPPVPRNTQPNPPSSQNAPGLREVEDLMDKVTLDDNSGNRPILQQISNKINSLLESDDGILSTIPFIEQQQHKIDALHGQLSNHLKQAHANEENLQSHINYVQGQVESIKKLNEELQQLDQINASSKDEIATGTGPGQKLKLEEIITPDSILVNQLYDTVADIKAHKDTINLVGGNFKGEEEIINDSNMEQCIKSVRGLARELFWLEVTKSEIGKSMGLQL